MNKVFIKICGTSASGKSTIGEEIRNFLKENGFDVEFYDDEQVPPIHEDRVEALKRKNTKVLIETVQLYTDLTDSTLQTLKMPKGSITCKK